VLQEREWGDLSVRIGRDISSVADACTSAMTLADHHEWIRVAANRLKCGGDTLWQAMCAEWAKTISGNDANSIVRPIEEILP
jgi:hypothetical protein